MDWISVKERLPEDDNEVFVVTRSKKGQRNVDKGYYLPEDGRFVHRGTAEVTHWIPLPKLPEPAKEVCR